MTTIATTVSPPRAQDVRSYLTDESGDAETMRRLEAFLLIARFTRR